MDSNFTNGRTEHSKVAVKRRNKDFRSLPCFKQQLFGPNGLRRFLGIVQRSSLIANLVEKSFNAKKHSVMNTIGDCSASQRFLTDFSLEKADGLSDFSSTANFIPYTLSHDDALDTTLDRHTLAVGFSEFESSKLDQKHQKAHEVGILSRSKSGLSSGEKSSQITDNLGLLENNSNSFSYHSRQLGILIGLVYEFNHSTFQKIPIKDTLQLLHRCSSETVNHLIEFEGEEFLRHQKLHK